MTLEISLFIWFDWLIVAVLAISTMVSLWRGFAREAISLLGWVAAFVLAHLFAAELALSLTATIDNETARSVAAYVLIFVATLMLANLAGWVVVKLVKVTGLSLLDRVLGTIFGFARGVIVILVTIFIATEMLPPEQLQWLQSSQLAPHIDMLVQWVETVLGPAMNSAGSTTVT